tara:strand:- start:70 stop:609 length:540 start_codon:yes stop_codon:yes gene_type:complete
MGKRSNFARVERDYYPTPIKAVEPLIPHLPYAFDYVEPCAGDGRLIRHITELTEGTAECIYASDIEPKADNIRCADANSLYFGGYGTIDYMITNPPWDRKILHPMIEHWLEICPTWLLFDSDWVHTQQSAPYIEYCSKIVSVGRVKWIEGSKGVGYDNCCWHLFDINAKRTEFYGKVMK